MSKLLLDKKHPIFKLLEKHIKDALKNEVEISDQWEISKEYFEEIWSATTLSESVTRKFKIKLSDSEIETDFQDEDDIESLSNCFVEFECTDELREIFIASGLRPALVMDVFNDIYGTDINLLSADDVENNVSLLRAYVEDADLMEKSQKNLVEFFNKFNY